MIQTLENEVAEQQENMELLDILLFAGSILEENLVGKAKRLEQ